MAVLKQGGGPNPPVQLDPVQIIVGVGWPQYTHLDVSVVLNFRRTDSATIDVGCVPYDTVAEGVDHVDRYMLSAGYEFPPGFLASIRGRRTNGTWVGLNPSLVEVTGLPTLPVDFSAAAWTWPISGALRFNSPVMEDDGPAYFTSLGATYQTPTMVWVPPSGANTAIAFAPGVFYKDTLDGHVATVSDPFSGGPLCVGFRATPTSRRYAPIDVGNMQTFNTFQPVTAMSAVLGGQTYTAVGSHLRQTGLVREYTLFTLLERQEESV